MGEERSFDSSILLMMEDPLLIWRFKRGSRDALQRIYQKYKNDLLKLAVSLVNDVNTAEDVVQEVFVSFARMRPTIRPTGSLRKYLVACVANRIRSQRRSQKRHEAADVSETGNLARGARRPEQWAILSEELQAVSEALAQIPFEQREVVSLYMEGGMTFRQIAAVQQVSSNTVQGRYRYGMNKLRSLLNSRLSDESTK